MRIALLSDRYPPDPGGLSQAAQRIAEGLAGRGLQVDVYAAASGPVPGTWSEDDGGAVTVRRLGAHPGDEIGDVGVAGALGGGELAILCHGRGTACRRGLIGLRVGRLGRRGHGARMLEGAPVYTKLG